MKKYPWYLTFWFSWFVTTITYFLVGYITLAFTTDHLRLIFIKIYKFLEIFTPFSFYTILKTILFFPYNLLIIGLFILFLFSDKILFPRTLDKPIIKIAINLLLLFILTSLIDLILFHFVPIFSLFL